MFDRHALQHLLTLMVLLSTGSPLLAQATKPLKIGNVTVTGSLRVRWEGWDWFYTPAANSDYNFWGSLLRVSAGQERLRWDWQVEGAVPVLLNLPGDAVAPPPQGQLGLGATYFASNGRQNGSLFLKQAFVRFKEIGSEANSFRFGRIEFIEGLESVPKNATLAALKKSRIAHRLIGNFGFTHVGRSFDALQFVRNTSASNVTLLAGRPTEGVFKLNGNGELNVNVYYGAYSRGLHRGSGQESRGEFRLFALHYEDRRHVLKTDNRPLALRAADTSNLQIATVGSHYLRTLEVGAGTADLLVWGVWQTGRWGQLDHRAGAVALEGGYQPNFPRLKPWVRLGYFRSTGDGNPLDGKHHTFFQVLPTPRIYARFPFFNLMNSEDLFAQLTLRPHKRWSFQSELHQLDLSQRSDLWYQGGGAYQDNVFGYSGRPSGGSRSLGLLWDLNADWQVSARTTLSFYYARAMGRGVIAGIYPEGKSANFAFVEINQRF